MDMLVWAGWFFGLTVFVCLVFGLTAFVFCYGGSNSAKNQIADLKNRVAQLEAVVGSSKPGSES
jgi:hypothetical protein